MTSEDIRNRKWTEAEKQALRRASAKQAAGDDSDTDYSDIPKLTPEQLASMVRLRDVQRKVPVSVRLDPQVLDWLRSKGEGHLTRINNILTNLMKAERRVSLPRFNEKQQDVVGSSFICTKCGIIHSGGVMAKKEIFVERRPQGDYAIRRPGSDRASAVEPTQADAIDRASQIAPKATVLVERVRNTDVGSRDKWRKP